MKEIKAYIKKHKLDAVMSALRKIDGLSGVSILNSSGFGAGWRSTAGGNERNPGVKIELVCREALVDEVVSTIEKSAHTGLKGDGKIYVSAIEQAVRISTGERGETAA